VSSLTNAEMLNYWHVTNGLKMYYFSPDTPDTPLVWDGD
jgi:hypothetical protein